MSIENQLTDELKQAMRSNDVAKKDTLRMVLSEGKKFKTSSENKNQDMNDTSWLKVISSYVKSLNKSLDEFKKIDNDQCKSTVDQINYELGYWKTYLPEMLSEKETEDLVLAAIANLEIKSEKERGKLMGVLMRTHKDKLDGKIVKTVVDNYFKTLSA